MNCFKHKKEPAVGICKECNKGLCHKCLSDLGHGIACKGVHESAVEEVHKLITQNTKIYNSAPRNSLIGPLLLLFMGLFFVATNYFTGRLLTNPMSIFGVGIMVFAIISLIRNRQLFK